MFLAFQYPHAIPGVTVANFLRMAVNAHRRSPEGEENPIRIPEFRKLLQENMEMLKIDRSMTSRYINDGFSGGEKKRMEILQMAVLHRSWRSWTRPTPASTSTPCGSSPTGSTGCCRPRWVCS